MMDRKKRIEAIKQNLDTNKNLSVYEKAFKIVINQLKYCFDNCKELNLYGNKAEGKISKVNVSKNGLEIILGEHTAFTSSYMVDDKPEPREGLRFEMMEEGEPEEGFYCYEGEEKKKKGTYFIHKTLIEDLKKDIYDFEKIKQNIEIKIFYNEFEIILNGETINGEIKPEKRNIDFITKR
jgi:hypothetical protein